MSKHFRNYRYYITILILFKVMFSIENPLRFNHNLDRIEQRPGEVVSLFLDIKIDKGWHIYATNPEQSLRPTEIEYFDTTIFDQVGIIEEPKKTFKYDKNFDMEVGLHYGNFLLKQDLLLSEKIKPNIYNVDATLSYLVCDSSKCIPKWDDFSFELNIEEGEIRTEYVKNIILDHNTTLKSDNMLTDDESFNNALKGGFLSFILFAMGMGFLALLTPCVFPMIPITVSFFTKHGEDNDTNPIYAALTYTIGIIIIFTSLGLLLAFTLGATGANQIASSPIINLFIAGLFIYFAFSLFGQYEIRLPSAMQQFSLKQESQGGIVGILFMALTFTLTSFTCTVQFVGLLLVAASQGETFWPIVGMLAFSFTFALPFFFLALFPQYLSKIPKSGGWLNSVKVIMGFLELAAAMKFLSNADLVLGWGVFTYHCVLAVWVVIATLMGIYLLGKIKLPHDSNLDYVGVPRLVLSVVFLTFGLYMSRGLYGESIHGLIDSYLPPKIESKSVDTVHSDEFAWIENFEQGMKTARELNKPVFVDFTGYTCTNCRWMETNVFEEPPVKELFKEFVLVRLYTDAGENHREYQKMEVERFNTAALPFYVILTPDDKEITRFPGMDTDVSKFVNFLKEGLLY